MSEWALEVGARGMLILAGAALLARSFPAHRAAWRHGVWTVGLGAMVWILLVPALTPLIPPWSAPGTSAPTLPAPPSTPGGIEIAPGPGPVTTGVSHSPWWWIWWAGAVVASGRLALGYARVSRVLRRSRPLDGGRARDLIGPGVRLLESSAIEAPFTAGILRRTVVLPASHVLWSDSALRCALAHEAAHVRRRDCLWLVLGAGVGVLYWFHPLVHLALREQRATAEEACDQEACAAGLRTSTYLDALVEIGGRGLAGAWAASWRGNRGELGRRAEALVAVHAGGRRGRALGALTWITTLVLVGARPAPVEGRILEVLGTLGTEAERADLLERRTLDPATALQASLLMRTDACIVDLLDQALRAPSRHRGWTASFFGALERLRSDAARVDLARALMRKVSLHPRDQHRLCDLAASLSAEAARTELLVSLVRRQEPGVSVRRHVLEIARSLERPSSRSAVARALDD